MRTGLLIGVSVLLAASLWTAPRRNLAASPLLAGAEVPVSVRAILERSCQDCHSGRTRYPWYSYVAPVSLLIGRDVRAGRERLDLSNWSGYSTVRQIRFLSEIANQVKEREMPLPIYTIMHRNARLSDAEIDAVFRWTQAERLRILTAGAQ